MIKIGLSPAYLCVLRRSVGANLGCDDLYRFAVQCTDVCSPAFRRKGSIARRFRLKPGLRTVHAIATRSGAPVKYSGGLSHDLRSPCKETQIVHHCTTSQVE